MTTQRLAVTLATIALTAFSALAAKQPGKAVAPRDEQAAQTPIVKSGNDFTLDLYRQLCAAEKGNLFFSPSSIHTALSMTWAGARGMTERNMAAALKFPTLDGAAAGPNVRIAFRPWTQEQLHPAYAELLRQLNAPPDAGYHLHVANALWGQKGYPWVPEFLDTTRKHYGAGLREVDFASATEAARQDINRWVEDQTNQKIKDLIARGVLDELTRLVLTNAIYFKGDWASKFKEAATKDAPFKLEGGKTVQAPLMFQKAKFGYREEDDLQVLSMPYKGGDLSMVVLLPKKDDGLADLEGKLESGKLAAWTGRMPIREVQVYLPKFKLECQFSLKDVLTKMGMGDAFSPSSADFSGMDGKKDLYITAVIHKAFVDVNEEGTEAAAATAVVVGIRSAMPERPLVFRADHPFLFLIRHDKTGAVLFMGRVNNPVK